ncbi:BglG family transcription antiterminator [Lonepinella koalarum]
MLLTKRQSFLVQLLEKSHSYITVKELAQKCGCSERTIHYELNNLADYLAENSKVIEKRSGVGVMLTEHVAKNNLTKTSNKTSLHKRRVEIAYQLLFQEKILSYNLLSEKYFVSKTSIKRDLDYINNNIVSLNSNYQGTFIEQQPEALFLAFFRFNEFILSHENKDHVVLLKQYYSSEIVDFCLQELAFFLDKNQNAFAYNDSKNILNHLVIFFFNLNKGIHYTTTQILSKNIRTKTLFSFMKMILSVAKNLSIELENSDVDFLVQYIVFNKSSLIQENENYYHAIIKNLINKMSLIINVDFSKNQFLIERLSSHIPSMLERLKNKIMVKNEFSHELKLNYPEMFNAVIMATEDVFPNIDLNENEVAFITIYFQAALENILTDKRKILLVCSLGNAALAFLQHRFNHAIKNTDELTAVSYENINNLALEDYQYVFSTLELNTNYPYHKISLLVSEQEIISIINSHDKVKSIKFDNYFKLITDFNNKEQILTYATNFLAQRNRVSTDFLESILNREKIGSTDFPTGVATPHGAVDRVYQTSIVFIKNNRKIKWQDYYVNLIILICISQQDLKRSRVIISDIYNIINNQDILNEIRKDMENMNNNNY